MSFSEFIKYLVENLVLYAVTHTVDCTTENNINANINGTQLAPAKAQR